MRLRGRGPRAAPASGAGAGDAPRLAPPGRNPFVHELRLSALQKAQVGSPYARARAGGDADPGGAAGMGWGGGPGQSGPASRGPSPAAALSPRGQRSHSPMRSAAGSSGPVTRLPAVRTPFARYPHP
jgi:hypothetical protein